MPALLLVDDDPVNLEIMADCVGEQDFQLLFARNGYEAWEQLSAQPDLVDALLLDRIMPRMNGMELLSRLKADERLEALPVIMQTSADSTREVEEGLAAGAWYYLAKPYDCQALKGIVAAALADGRSRRQLMQLNTAVEQFLGLNDHAIYRFRSPEQAQCLAAMLARHCPDRPSLAMGLSELMLNAVEHGNLGFNYEDKTRLMASGEWSQAVERRLTDTAQQDRWAQMEFRRSDERLVFTIQDQGNGFDWRRYLVMDSARAFDCHGRGIALANSLSFSSLEYQGCGNRVQATLVLGPGDGTTA